MRRSTAGNEATLQIARLRALKELTMNIRTPDTKSAVNLFRAHLSAAGVHVPLNLAQEGYAKSKGFDDWQALVAFEKNSQRRFRAGTNLFDYRPQLTEIEHGPEKSLRTVLLEWYGHHDIRGEAAAKLVREYLQSASAFLASEVRGESPSAEPTVAEVLKRVSGWARNYDLGTPEGHAIADAIDSYSIEAGAATVASALKRASDLARNYDLGTPEGHAIADSIDRYCSRLTKRN
jgi:hypothetical protein